MDKSPCPYGTWVLVGERHKQDVKVRYVALAVAGDLESHLGDAILIYRVCIS